MMWGVLIPIIAVGAPFLMIIVSTMSKHQLAMAELVQKNSQMVDPRIDALQREMTELKALVHQQTIVLDNLANPLPTAKIQDRVIGG